MIDLDSALIVAFIEIQNRNISEVRLGSAPPHLQQRHPLEEACPGLSRTKIFAIIVHTITITIGNRTTSCGFGNVLQQQDIYLLYQNAIAICILTTP